MLLLWVLLLLVLPLQVFLHQPLFARGGAIKQPKLSLLVIAAIR
jgi:hypothetical protein